MAGKACNASSINFRLLMLPTLTHKIAGPLLPAARRMGKSRSLVTRTAEREIVIPNLLIGSYEQTEIDDMNCLESGLTQCPHQRGRKLRID